MKVLGIDPSIRSTGWAVIESVGSPDFVGDAEEDAVTCHFELVDWGIIKTDRTLGTPARLYAIFWGIHKILEDYRLANCPVCIETPFVLPPPRGSMKTALVLGRVIGVCESCVWGYTDGVFEYAPKEIKKIVAGSGGASKEEVRKAVSGWIELPEDLPLDVSDAVAVALAYWLGKK